MRRPIFICVVVLATIPMFSAQSGSDKESGPLTSRSQIRGESSEPDTNKGERKREEEESKCKKVKSARWCCMNFLKYFEPNVKPEVNPHVGSYFQLCRGATVPRYGG
uniref:AlNc14C233G9321 protein n=1 Tax=Albugo laibachii Nc14 TaxID=890382 RepID=F0WSH8_9STRA|nr:AlNc14C233G9321 [Albugo laibachii Nc14]|eukprot:CCA24301.1 AlNc14C233G9321 [Albugo laibachii Nc14]